MKKSYLIAAGIVLCAIIVVLILAIPSKDESIRLAKSVKFKLEKTFGAESSPKEALLTRVYTMETDNKGNLYLINGGKILSFAQDGTLRWSINKKGEGPGDLENICGLTTDGNNYLYVSNVNGSRIDKFNLDGQFLNSFTLSQLHLNFTSIIGFIQPNLLVISQTLMGKVASEIIILETDNSYKIRNRFIVDKTAGLKLSPNTALGFSSGIIGNRIACGSLTSYELTFYDTEGKEVQKITKKVKNLILGYAFENGCGIAGDLTVPYKIAGSYYISYLNYPHNVTEQSQLHKKEFKKEYATVIDIFNDKGILIYSDKKEGNDNSEIGKPIYSDLEGYLYTFKELPYPQICKYKVTIEE